MGIKWSWLKEMRNLSIEVAQELDNVVIWGNGTDYKILEDAQIEDADVFVAATGDEQCQSMHLF